MSDRGERGIIGVTLLLMGIYIFLLLGVSRLDGVRGMWDALPEEQKLLVSAVIFIFPVMGWCCLAGIALRQIRKEINRGNYYQVRFIVLAECAGKAMKEARFDRVKKLLQKLYEEKGKYKKFCA